MMDYLSDRNWRLSFYTEEHAMSMLMTKQPWIKALETVLGLAAKLEMEGYRRIQQADDYILLVKRYQPEVWFVIRIDPVHLPRYQAQALQLEAV